MSVVTIGHPAARLLTLFFTSLFTPQFTMFFTPLHKPTGTPERTRASNSVLILTFAALA